MPGSLSHSPFPHALRPADRIFTTNDSAQVLTNSLIEPISCTVRNISQNTSAKGEPALAAPERGSARGDGFLLELHL